MEEITKDPTDIKHIIKDDIHILITVYATSKKNKCLGNHSKPKQIQDDTENLIFTIFIKNIDFSIIFKKTVEPYDFSELCHTFMKEIIPTTYILFQKQRRKHLSNNFIKLASL